MISEFIKSFSKIFPEIKLNPWEVVDNLEEIILSCLGGLSKDYRIKDEIAIHKSVKIENGVVIKGPAIICENCFIASNAYLRGPLFLGNSVTIGPGVEIKQSIIFENSSVAHLNYLGNSIIGANVNFEAGSIIANHYNERTDKEISVLVDDRIINTYSNKFGALVGDNVKVGANAVLSPGTILKPNSIVKRLELISQI